MQEEKDKERGERERKGYSLERAHRFVSLPAKFQSNEQYSK
jgi:hypothetical protein